MGCFLKRHEIFHESPAVWCVGGEIVVALVFQGWLAFGMERSISHLLVYGSPKGKTVCVLSCVPGDE